MARTIEVSACAWIDKDTEIRFLTARDGSTEFTFDSPVDGLTIEASEGGLGKLAEVVNAAVRDRFATNEAEFTAAASAPEHAGAGPR